jgi:hypothetical protein
MKKAPFTFTEEQKQRLVSWAETLEVFGEHRQGRRMLCSISAEEKKYCCLGVYLASTYGEGADRWIFDKMTNVYHFIVKGEFTVMGTLPFADTYALGLEQIWWETRPLIDGFVCMNDILRYSFLRIALEIRKLMLTGNFSYEAQSDLTKVYRRG